MSKDIVIRAEGLGKKYVIGHAAERERYTALRDVLVRSASSLWRKTLDMAKGRPIVSGDAIEEFWALKDLDFEIGRGEVVGIIGRNGAGKTTLLKILSRITEPTEGRVRIKGRVASLLEVGTGFHPELTGRENIYLNGAILGMGRSEIRRKFDEIVAFAEVDKFLDTPVKRYSSGMYVRLAFAVAAHLEPEILIVDEVLAVGDIEFQRKCQGKMDDVASHGRTVLLVSHNMSAVQSICPRSIYLVGGQCALDGDTNQVINSYVEHQEVSGRQASEGLEIEKGLKFEGLSASHAIVGVGDDLEITISFSATKPGRIVECAILLYSYTGVRASVLDLRDSVAIPLRYEEGRFEFRTKIEEVPLVEGTYSIGMVLVTSDYSGEMFDLGRFSVVQRQASEHLVPYPAESRGIVVLKSRTVVKLNDNQLVI